VMDVMEALGLNSVELEEMLDAVKASNEYSEGAAETIEAMLPRLRELAAGRGWSQLDIAWLIEGLGAYADYSFNKAHAASYGEVAYRTAYMRVNHPLHFWFGMLVAYADHDNITRYVNEARHDGIRIAPAHVNRSKATYSIDPARPNTIRRGLTAVRGIGVVAAAELEAKQPFTSLMDMGERLLPRRVTGARNIVLGMSPAESGGMIAALWDSDALEGLE
jgi:DNA polymerase III subunit alpha